jgi:hypothetical protein
VPALRFTLAPLICFALALAGCSSGDNSGLPKNWERFREGAFAGAIHRDWDAQYLDAASLDDGGLELPDSISSAFDAFIAAGNTQVFFVYLEQTPTNDFVTNINILHCEAAEAVPIVSDPAKLVEYYQSVKVPAVQHARVEFRQRDFVILKLEVAPLFDTYQVYIELDGCYLPATLTTRKGEAFWVDAFGTFISYLEPDLSQLRRGSPSATPTSQP